MNKQQESQIARKTLIKQSREAKEKQSEIMNSTGDITSINLILKSLHHERTGAKVLISFTDWKRLGFRIIKNSKSVRIWGKKRRVKENFKDNSSYSFYPMCCLFSEDQVIPIDEKTTIDNVIANYQADINGQNIH